MAQAGNSKVISLGDRARTRAARESASVLAEIRDFALDHLVEALFRILDRVEDDLFIVSHTAADELERQQQIRVRGELQARRADVVSAFRERFAASFDRKARRETEAVATPVENVRLDDRRLAEAVATREMALRLEAACAAELAALEPSIALRLGETRIRGDANPLGPATFAAALREALAAAFEPPVRLMLLQHLEPHLAPELAQVYGAVREKPFASAASGTAHARALGAFDEAAPLAWLLLGEAPHAPVASPALVGELTRLHRERGPLITATDEVLVNVVHELKRCAQEAGSHEAAVAELVALMFDFVFDDRHIPASAKSVLGRLQIPVLKMALLEPAFLSSKGHPARRFLDRLSEAAFGLHDSYAQGGAALATIEKVVDRVLAELDSEAALFGSLSEALEAFIGECRDEENALVGRSQAVILESERENAGRRAAQDAVDLRLQSRAWVPPAVHRMLSETWVRALRSAFREEGEASPGWNALLQSMDDLLWSVQPKSSADDRRRLLGQLPAMLERIEAGMARGGLRGPERDAFLGVLVDCHAAAVKAGLGGALAVPDTPTAAEPPAAPMIERALLSAGDVRVEEIRLRAPKVRPGGRNVFTRSGIWANLQPGTWVEFRHGAGAASMRARLTWIAPDKGVYLFTNPLAASSALSVCPEALAEQMRIGEARILDDSPLTERAFESLRARFASARG